MFELINWDSSAQEQLQLLVPQLEFYDNFNDAKEVIDQVLKQDIRRGYQRIPKGQQAIQQTEGCPYNFRIDRLIVHFTCYEKEIRVTVNQVKLANEQEGEEEDEEERQEDDNNNNNTSTHITT